MTEERVEYLVKQPSIKGTTFIQEESGNDLRKYRTEMPNIVDDMGLDPYSFRLYVHLRRVVGSEGKCWQNTKTLAKICSMSAGKISDAKKILVRHNLIRVEERNSDESDVITVLNIWPQNFEHFSALKEGEPVHVVNTPVHHMNTGVHHMNATRSPHELKKEPITKNKPNEEKQKGAQRPKREATPPHPMTKPITDAYVECIGYTPAPSKFRQIGPDAKHIAQLGHTPDDIRHAYAILKADEWWESKTIPLSKVLEQIEKTKATIRNRGEEGNGQAASGTGFSPEEIERIRELRREGKREEAGAYVRAINARSAAKL